MDSRKIFLGQKKRRTLSGTTSETSESNVLVLFVGLAAFLAVAEAAAAETALTGAAKVATRSAAALVGRTFFTRTSHINLHGAPHEFLTFELADRLLGFFGGAHGDECKPAGSSREFIAHNRHFGDRTGLGEQILQLLLFGMPGEVANE